MQDAGTTGTLLQFVPILIIFAIFYFLLIAPARKRQKALREMVSNLKKGDRVVTTGGFLGEVSSVKDDTIILKLADNVRVRVTRAAIAGMEGPETGGGA